MRTGRPLAIGFDVTQTCGPRAGCAWYADALIRALAEAAPRNRYYLYHRFGRHINTRPEAGTRIERRNTHHPFLDLDQAQSAALWKAVAAGKARLPGNPDIVQSNSFQAPETGRARLVVVVHDVSFWAHPEFTTEINRLTCQRGLCEALRRASGLLFVSEFSRGEFNRMLPGWLEENALPNAVIWEASRISAPVEAPAEGAYWLAVGSVEPRKNYEALLSAMELYWARSARRLPLHVAGEGGWRNRAVLAKMAALEKAGVVRRLGYAPEETLPGLYRGARGLIFPSWYEGFGLPVLEAMRCGCPVICSAQASLPEIGGDAAVYIDPASPGSICEAMLRLEADNARRLRLAETGRAQASRFSWSATARATLDFYERVLAHSPKKNAGKGAL